jgi:hypothetical protein
MKNYSLKQCEDLINKYVNELQGECTEIEEGCLGLGKILLHGAKGKKSILIEEYFISAWASGHTVKMYNKLPKKYHNLL